MKWFWNRYGTSSDIAYDNVNTALGVGRSGTQGCSGTRVCVRHSSAPGPHWLYDEVLNPYVRRLLDGEVESEQTLKRIFDFIEHLSASADKEVRAVVTDTILAALEGEPRLAVARRYMGPATRRLLRRPNSNLNRRYHPASTR